MKPHYILFTGGAKALWLNIFCLQPLRNQIGLRPNYFGLGDQVVSLIIAFTVLFGARYVLNGLIIVQTCCLVNGLKVIAFREVITDNVRLS